MLNVRSFFTFSAALGIVYGLGFLLAPALLEQAYGARGCQVSLLAFRFFGVALLGLGLVFGALRTCQDLALLRGILLGHAVANAAGVAVALMGVLGGTVNALGWSSVAIYVALTAGDLYLLARLQASSRYAI